MAEIVVTCTLDITSDGKRLLWSKLSIGWPSFGRTTLKEAERFCTALSVAMDAASKMEAELDSEDGQPRMRT